MLAPVKARYEELAGDEVAIESLLEKGGRQGLRRRFHQAAEAQEAIGLLTPAS